MKCLQQLKPIRGLEIKAPLFDTALLVTMKPGKDSNSVVLKKGKE